ncbi:MULTISPECIES: hypothetical protein [Enterococcus]|uniref:hypothetical protein n=1 Tax=Bacilli TaxID=91061 RepID=UPI0025B520AB|nr:MULTISPECIES: hypothetical protein [Enterococcus]MDN3040499.1 hypothetical protein [Enterococcus faecium]MDN3079953.1 hypothetical protein [Enterococcus faecium]MDN3123395.1 hypothetical protein [Enterococcus faecalis]MDN3155472.1 hypothetical protein [Enterococcus faecalis]
MTPALRSVAAAMRRAIPVRVRYRTRVPALRIRRTRIRVQAATIRPPVLRSTAGRAAAGATGEQYLSR